MSVLRLFFASLCISLAAHANPVFNSTFFGYHFHASAQQSQANGMGFGQVRFWDTYTRWADLEPQRGVYNFTTLDTLVTRAQGQGQGITLTLGSTPAWASSRPTESCAYGSGCAAPPANLQDWTDYVTKVALRYRGRIQCYEVWNEVSFPTVYGGGSTSFFSGKPYDLVQLSRLAYQAIKAADPSACVLSPSFHVTGDWFLKLQSFLNAGGGSTFDVLSWHLYYAPAWPEKSAGHIQRLRSILNSYGLTTKPIWNSEVGVPFAIFETTVAQTQTPSNLDYALLLRSYLIDAAFGVSRVFWYAWDDGTFGMAQPTSYASQGAKPAISSVIAFLSGKTVTGCTETNYLWKCTLATATGSPQTVVWADSAVGSLSYTIPATASRVYQVGLLSTMAAGQTVTLGYQPLIIQ
ncbi:beta-galactosidase [Paludibacterium yongneupense]|uniref:beta-galactosidase n=1 Tax=Paludibacterium yongneupense TaxID=400061 RepID=UPI0003F8E844|nr:beta-galactosidase [Paludibacterium yongneupense]